MMITRFFDSTHLITNALRSIEEELNSRKLVPVGTPKLLVEGEEHKVFYDNVGNGISAYCGVIVQQVAPSYLSGVLHHYAIHEFGVLTSGNKTISEALEKIDAEIEKQKGNAKGDIQILKAYSCRGSSWTKYGGVVVQVYTENTLENAFK